MPPALGIPIMTALSKEKHQINLYDENIEEIDYNDNADLIAISFFTPQANYWATRAFPLPPFMPRLSMKRK